MANSNGPRQPAAGRYPPPQTRPGEAGAHDPNYPYQQTDQNYGQWPEQQQQQTPQSFQQQPQHTQQQPGLAAYQNPAPDPVHDNAYPHHQGHAAPADPAHAQGNPLVPQFGAYDPSNNQAQANQQPHYDQTPQTGEPYAQNYGAGAGFQDPAQPADFHTGANPAFPQQDQNHFGQHAAAQHHADVQGFGAAGYAADPHQHPDPYASNDPTTAPPQDPAFATDPYGGHNYGYADDPHTQPAGARPGEGLAHAGMDEHDYGDAYETDERGGGRSRMMLIAGALVGAIVVGGGLAYGWKTISGTGAGGKTGQPPVVGASPSKKRPADPGGRTFDHTDSKIMGRLGERGTTSTGTGGSRKVVTVPVTRDGRIPGQAGAAKRADDVVSVPGLTVVDAFGTANRAPSAGNVTVTQPLQKKGAAPSSGSAKKPVVITRRTAPTTTKTAPAATGTTRTVTVTPTAPAATTTTARPPTRKPKTTPTTTATRTAPPAATPTATGGNGYVAVLASVPVSATSRMNALAQYADLQQKYAAVLNSKTPDVREANLGTRGKYHRLLVGPPASRAQATALCSKLKAAGYSGCWVTAY